MIYSRGVSVSPDGDIVSFWVTKSPGDHEQECIVLNAASGQEVCRIQGNATASAVAWYDNELGAFSEKDMTDSRGLWSVRIVGSRIDGCVERLQLSAFVSALSWSSRDKLAIVATPMNGLSALAGCVGRSDVTLADVTSGELETLTLQGDFAPPLTTLANGELWCVRSEGNHYEVYSITRDRAVWIRPRRRFLDQVSMIGLDGTVFTLRVHITALGVLWDILRCPSHASSLFRLLMGRVAVPTSVVALNPTDGSCWSSRPWHIISHAIGSDGQIGLSVQLGTDRYALIEYSANRQERVLVCTNQPLFLAGRSKAGWVASLSTHSVVVVHGEHLLTLYGE